MRCFSSEGTDTDHLDRCGSTNGERGWTASLLLPSRVLSIAFKRAQTAQTCLRCARDTLPQLRALASVNFCSTPGRSNDQLVKDDDAPGQVRGRERLRQLRDRAPSVSAAVGIDLDFGVAAHDRGAQETARDEVGAAAARETREHRSSQRNLIGAGTAAVEVAEKVDTLAEAVEDELIHIVAAKQAIATRSADEDVATRSADEHVVPLAAIDHVVALVAGQTVVSAIARDLVVAIAPGDHVVLAAALQGLVGGNLELADDHGRAPGDASRISRAASASV